MKHKLVKFLALTLVVLSSQLLNWSSSYAETEPNDTPSGANQLALGVIGDTNATLSSSSDVDWYKVDLQANHWYVFETYNVSTQLDSTLRLYSTNGSTQLASGDGDGSGDSQDRIAWQAPANGTYYLRVASYSGQGTYAIRALLHYNEGGAWNWDNNKPHEPNDNWQTAYPMSLGLGNAIQTTIYPRGPYKTVTGDKDYFHFELSQGQWYVFETFNVDTVLDTTLTLYNSSGTQVSSDDGDGKGNGQDMILWQAPANGTYYLRVSPWSSTGSGTYSVRVLPKGGPWEANEPNNSWVTAIPLATNQAYNDNLYQVGNYKTVTGDYDYFSFTGQSGYDYTINLTNVAATLDSNLYLLSLDGTTQLAYKTGSAGGSRSLTYKIATNGIYYALVRPYGSSNNTGAYQIQITTNAPPTTPRGWTGWQKNGATLSPVVMEVFNSRLYQVVRGSDNGIYTRYTIDGSNWSGWVGNGATPDMVEMTIFNNRLYQAVRGTDNGIYTRYTTDGTNWSGWVGNGATPGTVRMIVFNNRLYQAVRGTDDGIYTRYTFDGANWSGWVRNGATLGQLVEMMVFNGRLYQTVRGTDNGIYTRYTTDGDNWSGWSSNGATYNVIKMMVFNGRLYQAVQGTDNGIYTRYTIDGNNWSGWVGNGYATDTVEMTVFGSSLYQAVKGTDNGVYTRYTNDGSNWSGWERSGETRTSIRMKVFNPGNGSKLYQAIRGTDDGIYTRYLATAALREIDLTQPVKVPSNVYLPLVTKDK